MVPPQTILFQLVNFPDTDHENNNLESMRALGVLHFDFATAFITVPHGTLSEESKKL